MPDTHNPIPAILKAAPKERGRSVTIALPLSVFQAFAILGPVSFTRVVNDIAPRIPLDNAFDILPVPDGARVSESVYLSPYLEKLLMCISTRCYFKHAEIAGAMAPSTHGLIIQLILRYQKEHNL